MDGILMDLKSNGYKITPQRRAVINALLKYEHFATAQQLLEDVKESNPDISLDTIYRILSLLMRLDKVHKIDMKNSEGAAFELVKDGHHHHLICLKCGKVTEFSDDMLEELEQNTQIQIIESLSVEKAADVLEKMPADEVADILDAMESNKAEQLLNEMETDSSQEVRELLNYEEGTVGSIMTTEILTFNKNQNVQEIVNKIREEQPEDFTLYVMFVVDENEKLLGTFTLRDLILANPETLVENIMKDSPIHLNDNQEIDEIAENIDKYSLLAIPVIDENEILQGMIVVDDVIEDLIHHRKTNK